MRRAFYSSFRRSAMALALILFAARAVADDPPDSASARSDELATIERANGTTVRGVLVNINDTSIELVIKNARQRLGCHEVLRICWTAPDEKSSEALTEPHVILVDSSLVVGPVSQIVAGRAAIERGTSPMVLDRSDIRSVLVRPLAARSELARQWQQLASTAALGSDAVVIERSGSLDYLEGIVGDWQAGKIDFRFDDRHVEIDASRIHGVALYQPTGRSLAAPTAHVHLRDGSCLAVSRIDGHDGELALTLACGVELLCTVGEVAQIDYGASRFLDLAAVTPLAVEYRPAFEPADVADKVRQLEQPRVGQSFDGQPIDLALRQRAGLGWAVLRRDFANGLAMKPGWRVQYAVSPDIERLEGWVGLAPDNQAAESVRLEFRGDDRPIASQVVSRSTGPVQLSIPLDGASVLTIDVCGHQSGPAGGVVHFGDLRLVKKVSNRQPTR
jgi:hypothetical protein